MNKLARLAFLVGLAACASTSQPAVEGEGSADARYPRRGPGCELTTYDTAVPGVVAWDDLGVAEATCHINDPVAECQRRLKAEACRLGGDIMYNMPRKPFRPRDQVLVYRAQVAHSRTRTAPKAEDPDMPPPASKEEASGPVVPLPSASAAVAPTNAAPTAPTSTAPAATPASPSNARPGESP